MKKEEGGVFVVIVLDQIKLGRRMEENVYKA
jgi:hypothetical protein